ncbi:unnamed protein product [Mucor circinelloides]
MNFVLLILIQFFNTQQVELVQRYTNNITNVQRSINQLNHYVRLAEQLLTELLSLITNINQNIDTDSENITAALQGLTAPINNLLDQLRPHIQDVDDIVHQMHAAVTQENPDIANVNQLHDRLNHSVTELRPQINAVQALITQKLQYLRQTKTRIENDITDILDRLTQEERTIINIITQSRDTTERIESGRQMLRARLNQFRREDLNQAEILLQSQLNAQLRIFIQNQQDVLTASQRYQDQQRQTIEASADIQQCLQLDTIKRQLQQIEKQNTALFQLAEITSQQLSLAIAEPEGRPLFPKLTDATFWSHVYRKVAIDPNGLNRTIQFNQSIQRNFPDFDISRKIAGSEEYAYTVPTLDRLHIAISSQYGTTIIQNVVMHLLNTRLWIVRIFKGYFVSQQNPPDQEFRRLPIMTLAKKAADGIISHKRFDEIVFREENDDELPIFENLNNLYDQVRLIYEAEFPGLNYDQVDDYSTASSHPLKYLRLSYRLLQLATSMPDTPIKLWSLIPQGSHSIVHVSLSGVTVLYRLFKRAHENHLPVPERLIRNNVFIRLTDFDNAYFRYEEKRDLWNDVFDLARIQDRELRLGFGMKTDGHMISILFEKTAQNFVPQNKKEIMMQKTQKNLSNWTNGLYPLYKNPVGITAEDRIVGIDPGVRDIICGVDCDSGEMNNKQTTKEHSFFISNSSYKLRSGMSWLKQKELQSRTQTNIQASYDRLQTRKVCSNEGIMQFLNAFSGERTEIHRFMRSWQHREHKGYAYSDRKMAQDYIARVVLGRTKAGEDFKLAHSSSSSSRRKKRKRFRQQHQPELRPLTDIRRTVIAYGDANIRGTYKGNTPIPVKSVQRAIAEKAIVITVDEFRTSVTCCHCHRRLNNTTSELHGCNHRKKRHRIAGVEKRSRMKCLDEEGNIIHLSSQCPDRRLFRQNNTIYSLKLCTQCPVNRNNDLYWQRDINAATNIRSILVEYINSNFNIGSRPAALSRGRQDQGP